MVGLGRSIFSSKYVVKVFSGKICSTRQYFLIGNFLRELEWLVEDKLIKFIVFLTMIMNLKIVEVLLDNWS